MTPLRVEQREEWVNPLPGWIRASAGFADLPAGVRSTLRAVANACDAPDARGNLLGAFGGRRLADAAGVCKRTLWRHLARLEAGGFVVCVGRGGVIGDRNYANQYGIPGSRGALDARRARRPMMRMVEHADGVHRPLLIAPGEQASFWGAGPAIAGDDGPPNRGPGESGGCHDVTTGSDKMSRGVVTKWHTTIPSSIPCHHHSGGGAHGAAPPGGRWRLPGLSPRELADDARLAEVCAAAAAEGLIGGGEAEEVFAAAERALRVADRPGAMWATIVRGRRWEQLDRQDRQAARRRLRRLDDPARAGPTSRRLRRRPAAARATLRSWRGRGRSTGRGLGTSCKRPGGPPSGSPPPTNPRGAGDACAWNRPVVHPNGLRGSRQ